VEPSQSRSDMAKNRSARAYASALGTPSSAIRSAAKRRERVLLVGYKEWAQPRPAPRRFNPDTLDASPLATASRACSTCSAAGRS